MHIDRTYLRVVYTSHLTLQVVALVGSLREKVADSNQRQAETNTSSRSLTECLVGHKPKSHLRILRTNCVSEHEEAAARQPGSAATSYQLDYTIQSFGILGKYLIRHSRKSVQTRPIRL